MNVRYILMLWLFCVSSIVNSHSGNTDENGCHTNHDTGEYHCHNDSETRSLTLPDKAIAVVGVTIAIATYYCWFDKTSVCYQDIHQYDASSIQIIPHVSQDMYGFGISYSF